MIVKTRDLLNHIRCRRFAALARRSQLISIDDDEKLWSFGLRPNELHHFEQNTEGASPDFQQPLYRQVMSHYHDEFRGLVRDTIIQSGCRLVNEKKELRIQFNDDMTLSGWVDFMADSSDSRNIYFVRPASSRILLQEKYSYAKQRVAFFYPDEKGFYQIRIPADYSLATTDFWRKLMQLCSPWEVSGRLIYDIAFHNYLLHKDYPRTRFKLLVAMINSDAVLEKNKPGTEFVSLFDLTFVADQFEQRIETDLYRMINHIELDDDSPVDLVKNACQRNTTTACPFIENCFMHVPKKNSIFAYLQQHLGFREGPSKTDPLHDTYEMINSGMVHMLDVPISWLQREKNLMQRYCVENKFLFLNKKKIKAKLATLVYPLYFLDFEAFPAPLPRYQGEKAFQQSVFQFSVHRLTSPAKDFDRNNCEHWEYVAPIDRDHRRELVEYLCQAIPEGESSIVVYNQTFEEQRLQELADLFPEYRQRLDNMISRLFDLLKVLKNDYAFYSEHGFSKLESSTYNFYHPELSGSYSLKAVLPVFTEDKYKKLAIQNGTAAYLTYASSQFDPEIDQEATFNDLKAYCAQDTLALVEILKAIERRLEK
ncbi:MAG: DUF2779 domain-containing protein [Candidatus Izemoplasmatales bacterium]|nr:DUF2779 domain-containing protein [Candidatus Izemoplasmatales bacterium]